MRPRTQGDRPQPLEGPVYFSVSTRMNGAGRVGWLAAPSTIVTPSKTTSPVAVAARSLRLLPAVFTAVCTGPTPDHATSKDTVWTPPRLSLAIPEPLAVTLFRSAVLMIVAGTVGAPQVNENPPGQIAWNCSLAVGSGSSVSGASKSRVVCTNSVPGTVVPSPH